MVGLTLAPPPTTVTITTTTSGANIRYTVDGSVPTESNGTLIAASSGTASVTSTAQGAVLKAIAFKTGWNTSAVKSSATYSMPQVATPILNPLGGSYPASSFPMTVTITTSTEGASMRYTLDGTIPTESYGTLIAGSSGSVSVSASSELTVMAFKPGWRTSEVQSRAFFIVDCPPNMECIQPAGLD
jgi:Chitobiase/beta-hexosaminidase C-terminal domain